jgi:hypothetical protein
MGASLGRGGALEPGEKQTLRRKKGGVSRSSGHPQHTRSPGEWPLKDQIRWAEWNLDLMVSRPELVDPTEGLPKRKDLEIWLLHKRDGLSLRQLARRFHGSIDSKSVSSVRRAIERAEKKHWGTSKFVGLSRSDQRKLALMLSGVPLET